MKKKKRLSKFARLGLFVLVVILGIAVTGVIQTLGNRVSGSLDIAGAQALADQQLATLPNPASPGAKWIGENSHVTVRDVSYGTEKNILLDCTYETVDAASIVRDNLDRYLTDVYTFYTDNLNGGRKTNATKVKLFLAEEMQNNLLAAEKVTGQVTLELFETSPGTYSLYFSEETVNTVFGGILEANALIKAADSVTYQGETVSIVNQNTLRTGIRDCLSLTNYDDKRPDTSIPLKQFWNSFKYDFERNFIVQNRWTYLLTGLLTTLEITVCAVLIGIVIGFVVAVIRSVSATTGKLKLADSICGGYVSLMRGTPVMVQLLIVYFVILLPLGVQKFTAAVLCFGLNSGAYVSEIVRGGIMSIDRGQTEAGRSLGFTYVQTMWYIVIPQAFKAVLPSLANEFIALLKESSVAFYIGVADLTLGGLKIRSITYSNYMPLIAVALIYLVLVLGLSKLVSLLERRLRKGDSR